MTTPILKNSGMFWMPAIGLIPLFLTVSLTLFQVLGGADANTVIRPLIYMTVAALAMTAILSTPLALGYFERRTILRLVNEDHWTRWPQYPDEGAWWQFAESEHARDVEASKFSWITFFGITGFFIVVAGGVFYVFGSLARNPVLQIASMILLGFLYILILTGMIGKPFFARRRAEATYNRRKGSPVPSVYIGKRGLYDDDKGYQTYHDNVEDLVKVEMKDTKPASLDFHIRRTTYHRGFMSTSTWVLPVRVPDGKEAEAKSLADRLQSEGAVRSDLAPS